jgi:hypothetical protein
MHFLSLPCVPRYVNNYSCHSKSSPRSWLWLEPRSSGMSTVIGLDDWRLTCWAPHMARRQEAAKSVCGLAAVQLGDSLVYSLSLRTCACLFTYVRTDLDERILMNSNPEHSRKVADSRYKQLLWKVDSSSANIDRIYGFSISFCLMSLYSLCI